MKLCYVRFGDLPKNGKSKIHNNGEFVIGSEIGISVYEAIDRGGSILPILPSIKSSACVTMEWILNRPLYLVSGNKIGIGSDGEPILENCKIIREIQRGNI